MLEGLLERLPGAQRIRHLLKRFGELSIESPHPPAPVGRDRGRGREETRHGRERRAGRSGDPGAAEREHQHRREVQADDLSWLDEQEHRAEIVHRTRDVALLVLLEGLAQHLRSEKGEEEHRTSTEEEHGRRRHHGPRAATFDSPRFPRMIWMVR